MRHGVALGLVLIGSPLFAADAPEGFSPLFNGKDLAGWHGWDIHKKGPRRPTSRNSRRERGRRRLKSGPPTR